MLISITLVHDKDDAGNLAQVQTLESFLTWDGIGTVTYSLQGTNHKFIIIEIVPLGVTPPAHSLKVIRRIIYGNDQPGTDGQFFNVGMSRGNGYFDADINIHLENIANLNKANIQDALAKLVNNTEFLENESFGKVNTKRFWNTMRDQADDTKSKSDQISSYKTKAVQRGLKNG